MHGHLDVTTGKMPTNSYITTHTLKLGSSNSYEEIILFRAVINYVQCPMHRHLDVTTGK